AVRSATRGRILFQDWSRAPQALAATAAARSAGCQALWGSFVCRLEQNRPASIPDGTGHCDSSRGLHARFDRGCGRAWQDDTSGVNPSATRGGTALLSCAGGRTSGSPRSVGVGVGRTVRRLRRGRDGLLAGASGARTSGGRQSVGAARRLYLLL